MKKEIYVRKVCTFFLVIALFAGLLPIAAAKPADATQRVKYYVAVYTTQTAYYTKDMIADNAKNIPKETQSVYFAISKGGKEFQYLNNNSGVIFAQEGTMRLVSPRIVRKGEEFQVYAMDSNKDKGVHIFTSGDGVFYSGETLSTKQSDIDVISETVPLQASAVTGFPKDDKISLGNALEITQAEYLNFSAKLGTVVNTGSKRVKSLSTDVGHPITEEELAREIPRVTAEYSDESAQDFKVDWTGALKDVDFSKKGEYSIQGKVVQNKYLNKDGVDATKFIDGLADPYIVYDEKTGYYYCTGSYFPSNEEKNAVKDSPYFGAQSYDRIILRRAKTLEGLQDRNGQVTLWKAGNQPWYQNEADTEGKLGYRYIWAPEIHRIGNHWVIYFTESESESNLYGIRCHALILDGEKDPYDTALQSADAQSQWKDYQMNAWDKDTTKQKDPTSEKPFTSTFCLDMTYFKDQANGQSYVVWAGKPTIAKGGSSTDLFIAKVDTKKPWKLASNSTRISWSQYGWEEISYYVNEGPSVVQHDGNVFLCYSASGTGSEYAMGMLSAESGADLLDVSCWTKSPYPLLTSKDVDGEEGPGHNSFTVDEDGNAIFVYHARPTSHNSKQCGTYGFALEDPCRHARIKRVHWASDGTPILKMLYENELADSCATVTATIYVGDTASAADEENKLTDYLFAYFPYTSFKDERIYFAVSEDGLNFNAINNGKYILESTKGTHGLRDPFIIRSHEGDKFYLLATDLTVYGVTQGGVKHPGMDWSENQRKGSRSIMVWESTDLVNWSKQRMCNVAMETAGCTWAPEAYYDDATGQYVVFWASKVSDDEYAKQRLYYATTRDFNSFSRPQVWIDESWSTIDTTVIKEGEYYYRYTKNESDAKNTNGTPGKRIYCERSKSMLGEWELVNADSLPMSGGQIEGPTVFKFNSEDTDQVKKLAALAGVTLTKDTLYGLYPDYIGKNIIPGVAEDITSGRFAILGKGASLKAEDGTSIYHMPVPKASHGTVLPITSEEYNNLMLKWDASYAAAAGQIIQKLKEEGRAISVTAEKNGNGTALNLPKAGKDGTAIKWISGNQGMITDDGQILSKKSATVRMTAVLTSDEMKVDGISLRKQTVKQDFIVTLQASGEIMVERYELDSPDEELPGTSGNETPSTPTAPADKTPSTPAVPVDKTPKSGEDKPKVPKKKSSLKVSGKSKITLKLSKKKKRSVKLKATTKGLSGKKIVWKITKGKKYIKLSKKTGKTVKITAKKKGTATVRISCGGKKVTKKIKVIK